jgi:hypothetical protein
LIICPHCYAEHADDPRNLPGVTNICVVCGEWWVAIAGGARGLTPPEAAKVARQPDCQRITAAWKKTMRQLGMGT